MKSKHLSSVFVSIVIQMQHLDECTNENQTWKTDLKRVHNSNQSSVTLIQFMKHFYSDARTFTFDFLLASF